MSATTVEAFVEIHSPVDGRLVGRLPAATAADVTDAVARARASQPGWHRTPAAERARALHAAAAAVRRNAAELAACQESETGRPRGEALGGIEAGADTLDQYAELGAVHRGRSLHGDWDATDLMVPCPRGVVVALTPWNDPVAIACGLIGGAPGGAAQPRGASGTGYGYGPELLDEFTTTKVVHLGVPR